METALVLAVLCADLRYLLLWVQKLLRKVMVSQLSVDEVADLLKKGNFPENVTKLFVANEIDGKAFLLLKNDEHLKYIGIALDDRSQLLDFISRLRGGKSDTSNEAQLETEAGLLQSVRKTHFTGSVFFHHESKVNA